MSSPVKILLWIASLVVFAVGSAWWATYCANQDLQRELAVVERHFEEMADDHKRAIRAADMALEARDEIYEYAQSRTVELENILSSCPDISNLDLPDDLRLFIQNACSGKYRISTPGAADARH